MAAPKNWELVEESNDPNYIKIWSHRRGTNLSVKKFGSRYSVSASRPKSRSSVGDEPYQHIGFFSNKEKANKAAVKWMRQHSQGI